MKASKPVTSMPPSESVDHRRRRYIFLGLSVIIIAAAAYFGPALRDREPDYYDPARAALVDAKQRFEESLVHEQALASHLQMAHEQLDSAISRLARVAKLDPAHRAAAESLRARLRAIENPEYPGNTTPEELQQSYRELLTQMDALIADMDSHTVPGK